MNHRAGVAFSLMALALAGCGSHAESSATVPAAIAGTIVIASDTVRPEYFEAPGSSAAVERSTLSTRLLATVQSVEVVEGAMVQAGQLLARLDARDLDARRLRVTAAVTDAEATAALARVTATRMRALAADSAAPRAQVDAAEAALARANAGLADARAAMVELEATAAYALVRAPFAGVVTRRYVDPGALAAPGAPLFDVESRGRLRLKASIPASLAHGLDAGRRLAARLDDVVVEATVEGAVPAGNGLYTVNALVENAGGKYLSGSVATLLIPTGKRHVVLVPTAALVHQGDLVGVRRRLQGVTELTWITVGTMSGDRTEVLSGLAAGDSVVVAAATTGPR